MTQRAGDAESRDVIVGIDSGLQANHGIHLEQRHRRRRTLEIDFLQDAGRQCVSIDFEADFQGGGRIDTLLDDFVEMERVGPQLLITERVEAKDALTLCDLTGRRWFAGLRIRAKCCGRDQHGERRREFTFRCHVDPAPSAENRGCRTLP